MLGVRWTISEIVPICQPIGVVRSITGISLLLPRIAVDMIAAQFPKAGLVAFSELEPVHPFCRLPEVKVWNEQACGSSVLSR